MDNNEPKSLFNDIPSTNPVSPMDTNPSTDSNVVPINNLEPIKLMKEMTETVMPAVEPVTEPVVESIAEPIVEPVVEPVIEPVVQPVAAPVAEPVVQSASEPVFEEVATQPAVTDAIDTNPTPAYVAPVQEEVEEHPELENTVITSAPVTPEALEEVMESESSAEQSSSVATNNNVQPAVETPAVSNTTGVSNDTTVPPIDINGGNFTNADANIEPPKKGGSGKIIGLIVIVLILGAVVIFLPNIQEFITKIQNPVEAPPEATPIPTQDAQPVQTLITCELTSEGTDGTTTIIESYTGIDNKLKEIGIVNEFTPVGTEEEIATRLGTLLTSCEAEKATMAHSNGVTLNCNNSSTTKFSRSMIYDLMLVDAYNDTLLEANQPTEEAPVETSNPVTVEGAIQTEFELDSSLDSIKDVKTNAGYTCELVVE